MLAALLDRSGRDAFRPAATSSPPAGSATSSDSSGRVSGTVLSSAASSTTATRTGLTFNRARMNLSPQLSVEPSLSRQLDRPADGQSFTTHARRHAHDLHVTPLLFVSALVQYNSSTHSVSTNARLRWEYRPGSELFVVYNEERDSEAVPAAPGLLNRAFIVKVNRFFRF